MENDNKVDLKVPDLLAKYRAAVREAIEIGVREALQKHKRAGNPVAVSRNGKVLILHPEKIKIT